MLQLELKLTGYRELNLWYTLYRTKNEAHFMDIVVSSNISLTVAKFTQNKAAWRHS